MPNNIVFTKPSLNSILVICLLVGQLLIPNNWVLQWDSYQFIILAVVVNIIFLRALLLNDVKLTITDVELSLGIFVLVGFSSYYWATNGALIWTLAFIGGSFFLWCLTLRSVLLPNNLNLHLLMVFIFFITLLQLLYFYNDIPVNGWQKEWGYNCNYSQLFAIALFSFFLFYNKEEQKVTESNSELLQVSRNTSLAQLTFYSFTSLKIIILLLLIWMNFKTSTDGSILVLACLSLYYLRTRGLSIAPILGIIGILVLLILFNPFLDYFVKGLSAKLSTDDARGVMALNSIQLFLEHPFLGVGLGNWYVEAYQYPISDTFFAETYRLNSHNLFTQLLAEVGIIGFTVFMYPLIRVLYYGWVHATSLTSLQQAGYGSLLVYVIGSFFYETANSFQYYYSALQFMGYTSIAILTVDWKTQISLKRIHLVFLTLFASSCLVWFIYLKTNQTKYLTGGNSIEKFESIYNPVFYTQVSYPRGSLPLRLALFWSRFNRKEHPKAEKYYAEALEQSPWDFNIISNYIQYLLVVKKDTIIAKEYALKMYHIQDNYSDNNLVLADLAIAQGQRKEAKKYLNKITRTNKRFILGALDEQLYILGVSSSLSFTKQQIDSITTFQRLPELLQLADQIEATTVGKKIRKLRSAYNEIITQRELSLMILLDEEQFREYMLDKTIFSSDAQRKVFLLLFRIPDLDRVKKIETASLLKSYELVSIYNNRRINLTNQLISENDLLAKELEKLKKNRDNSLAKRPINNVSKEQEEKMSNVSKDYELTQTTYERNKALLKRLSKENKKVAQELSTLKATRDKKLALLLTKEQLAEILR